MNAEVPQPDWKTYYQLEAAAHDFSADTDAVEIHRCLAAWSVFPRGLRKASLLDAGCGNGFFCHWMSSRIPLDRVAGADISAPRIALARQRYPAFEFQVASLEQLPWPDNTFDMVTCIEVLEHLPIPETALRELVRVSKRYVVITVPDRRPVRMLLCPHCGKSFPMYGHLQTFDVQRLETLLRSVGSEVETIRLFYAARGLRRGLPLPLARLLGWAIGRLTRSRGTFLAARAVKRATS
jgi:SAM-dependent methyltransferase